MQTNNSLYSHCLVNIDNFDEIFCLAYKESLRSVSSEILVKAFSECESGLVVEVHNKLAA